MYVQVSIVVFHKYSQRRAKHTREGEKKKNLRVRQEKKKIDDDYDKPTRRNNNSTYDRKKSLFLVQFTRKAGKRIEFCEDHSVVSV